MNREPSVDVPKVISVILGDDGAIYSLSGVLLSGAVRRGHRAKRAKPQSESEMGTAEQFESGISTAEQFDSEVNSYFGPPQKKNREMSEQELAELVRAVNTGRIDEQDAHFDPSDEFRVSTGMT